jgi:hypothetical protein
MTTAPKPDERLGLAVGLFKRLFSKKGLLATFAVLLASSVFFQASSEAAERLNGGFVATWNSPKSLEILLLLSPCIIFVITMIVYYRFIIDYTDEIAGLSVAGLLAALFCCVRLSESKPDDWAAHLKWVYCLFYSYVWWDALVCLVPKAKGKALSADDKKEIQVLSRNINKPTLVAVLLMWIAARHFVAQKVDTGAVGNYVEGVVAFHLVFASAVCVMNMPWSAVATVVPETTLENPIQDGLERDPKSPTPGETHV